MLLMEQQDGVVGISDRHGHFTPIDVLYDEAQRRGWIVQPEDSKEESMTQTSHRYADQGQIDAIWKIFDARRHSHALGEFMGPSTIRSDLQMHGQIVDQKLYTFEQLQDRVLIRVIDLSRDTLDYSNRPSLYSVTRDTLMKVNWPQEHLVPETESVYEHEAEALIAGLSAIDARTSNASLWV